MTLRGLLSGSSRRPKSLDAQVPYRKCLQQWHITYAHPHFKSSLNYLYCLMQCKCYVNSCQGGKFKIVFLELFGIFSPEYFWLVVMYGCESWTVKKAECRRIDAFELWCWRRLLRVPQTARRSNQSILKEISPGCSLEGLMLNLKLQYFGHFMRRVDSLEKTLMLGGIGGRRRRG